MASFQQDFNLGNLKKIIDTFQASKERKKMIDGLSYYKGDNTFIQTIVKTYWSDKYKAMMQNPYVSNYKIKSNLFHDIVSQKVNTLLSNTPIIQSDYTKNFPKRYVNKLGYALKSAGVKASSQSISFIFVGEDNNLTVFDSENCIYFLDDQTGKLRALIRYWIIKGTYSNTDEIVYCEIYEEDGLTLYKNYKVETPKTAYKFIKRTSAIDNEIENIDVGLPIVMLKNSDDQESDLTPSVKSKIDAIDLLESGFINNIEDFSNVFWVIKNGGGMDSDEFEDFVASINRTKKIIVSGDEGALDVDTKQIQIPETARSTLIQMLRKELIEETGVIDTATMTGSSLTTTAIEAATMKLQQRVGDFEWQAYNAAVQILEFYKRYNNVEFDFDIDFTMLLIRNKTEIIQNANLLRGNISRKSYLKLIKRADYIDDVDEEIKQIEEENKSVFSIIDVSGGN